MPKIEWAGYNKDGNDYKGHLHPDPEGDFITEDLRVGHFCVAPTLHYICLDPPPQVHP